MPSLTSAAVSTVGGAALSAPTDPTAGLTLVGTVAARVVVSADVGKTLDGTGNMRGYVFSPALGRWCAAPELDFPITPAGGTWTAQRDRCSIQFDLGVHQGRVTWVPDTVGTSGTNLSTLIEAAAGGSYAAW